MSEMATVPRRRWRPALTVSMAVALAVALVVAAFAMAAYNERLGQQERLRQAEVQLRILAGSMAAPLAFDDRSAAREYVGAQSSNPDVEAVGAYDMQGALAAGYTRAGAPPPPRNVLGPPRMDGARLVLTAPVTEDGTVLGSVYLRTVLESPTRRVMRYAGFALLIVMAALLIAVLGAASAREAEAYRELKAEIREREKAEDALRQSQKMEAMGQLTGGVAHDFNNLLMVASSGLDLLERTSDPARRERLRDGIRQAIDRGASLTQQLLAFSRRSPLKPEVVDIGQRLSGMLAILDRSLREDVTVRMQLPPDLWRVEVDASQMEVAVLNIAINARDAMPDGGTITIEARNEPSGRPDGVGDMVRLAIRDTGVGVAPDMVSRLFEPFFTTKAVGKGTGLGLSQVYGFARASGGEVGVDSVLGEGTTIWLRIPRTTKALVAPPPLAGRPSALGRDRQRVLLVEDDDSVAHLVEEMLRELGYEVKRVGDGASALDTLRSDPSFQLVFSDMVMPGDIGGLDLARDISRLRPDLPVVLTTGYSAAAAAASKEGRRVLVKPYRIEALAAELDAVLAGPSSRA
ncbi:ATP-binding protein [Caulobacter segnis]|uniref:histidine kinase n=2 Tax=Caulobacter segnis TaxID=88688 RepID=D5VM36_CAUST|nr:ATP-binding protein [Caulobacter segnis]ADG11559.1 integral membrane sensor hybrid histidine kinase [Caulobacter segnis ATCC 21756]